MPTGPRPTLLLTRPLPDSRALAARIGGPAVISPILRIEAVDHDGAALRRAPGLVFTSAHAVAVAGPGRGRPAICVGGRTAQAAREAGFAVTEGAGTADSLIPLIAASPVPLIHPHGRHLARALPVPGVVVYDQTAVALSDAARDLLAGQAPVVVPVFSPRSAGLLAGQVDGARAPLWVVAISDAALAAWTGPAARRAVSTAPSGPAMEAAIRRFLVAEQS